MDPFIDAQLAAVLQHAQRDPGDVSRVVQTAVRSALVLQAELLQHQAEFGLCTGNLEEQRKR